MVNVMINHHARCLVQTSFSSTSKVIVCTNPTEWSTWSTKVVGKKGSQEWHWSLVSGHTHTHLAPAASTIHKSTGYPSSLIISLPFGQYQIILLCDSGTTVWTTCPELVYSRAKTRIRTHDVSIVSLTRYDGHLLEDSHHWQLVTSRPSLIDRLCACVCDTETEWCGGTRCEELRGSNTWPWLVRRRRQRRRQRLRSWCVCKPLNCCWNRPRNSSPSTSPYWW